MMGALVTGVAWVALVQALMITEIAVRFRVDEPDLFSGAVSGSLLVFGMASYVIAGAL